jgi:hypothetical protein
MGNISSGLILVLLLVLVFLGVTLFFGLEN